MIIDANLFVSRFRETDVHHRVDSSPEFRQGEDMKATFDLPDELYNKVELFAAERGETVSKVLTQALELVVEDVEISGYVSTGAKDPYQGLSPEERSRRWDEDNAALMKRMEGAEIDPRSTVEIIREGRR